MVLHRRCGCFRLNICSPTRWARRRDMLHLPGFLQGKCNRLSGTVSLLSKDRGAGTRSTTIGTPVQVYTVPHSPGGTEVEVAVSGEETEGGEE